MTIILTRYENANGQIAYIGQEKDCRSYKLSICHRIEEDSPFVMTEYQGTYASKATARKAMNRFGQNWKKVFP